MSGEVSLEDVKPIEMLVVERPDSSTTSINSDLAMKELAALLGKKKVKEKEYVNKSLPKDIQ